MSLQPSTKLGLYEVISQIGAGGMGEVYKAKDTRARGLIQETHEQPQIHAPHQDIPFIPVSSFLKNPINRDEGDKKKQLMKSTNHHSIFVEDSP